MQVLFVLKSDNGALFCVSSPSPQQREADTAYRQGRAGDVD